MAISPSEGLYLTAALLAHWDGTSLPAALLRVGVAFGGTLTVLTALLALAVSTLT